MKYLPLPTALAWPKGDFYQGGPEAEQLLALPKRERVGWLVGNEIPSPLPAGHKLMVGREAAAALFQTTTIVHRTSEDAGYGSLCRYGFRRCTTCTRRASIGSGGVDEGPTQGTTPGKRNARSPKS